MSRVYRFPEVYKSKTWHDGGEIGTGESLQQIECHFIEDTSRDALIPDKMIMSILHRISCRLLWNGESIDAIKPARGLRLGDPMSPYLFVLCMEWLSHWILRKMDEGR